MTLNDHLRQRLVECGTLDEVARHLEGMISDFHDADRASDGSWRLVSGRAQVQRVGRLSIQIFPQDHAPAHFHVVFGHEVSAKFLLDNGDYLSGTIDSRDRKKIRCWFESLGAREKLHEVWKQMH